MYLSEVYERYIQFRTWIRYGRFYETSIEPFCLVEIDPSEVQKTIGVDVRNKFQYDNATPEIVGGDWDQNTMPLDTYDLYTAIQRRCKEDVEWENTDFYERVAAQLKEGRQKFGCSSISELNTRFTKIDQLITDIQENGYRTQYELKADDSLLSEHIPSIRPPEVHEVTINITRDGKLLLHEGRHRMSIAHAVGLEQIPVRIKVRHREWMEYRDYIASEGIDSDHPDLSHLS